jgi:hypothetical protein
MKLATLVPRSRPCTSAVRKCSPAQMRASTISSSGCENRPKARLPTELAARDAVMHHVRAEERLECAQMCTVEAHVPGRVVGVGRRQQRRPGRVRLGRRVPVQVGVSDRRPRPPEVEVVLVVPAVDRRIRAAQVHHREQKGTVGDNKFVSLSSVGGPAVRNCDELRMRNGLTPATHGVGVEYLHPFRVQEQLSVLGGRVRHLL